MKKVYLLANSQGTALGVESGQSYPALLQKDLPDYEFHFLIVSGWSSCDFFNNLENILLVNPDLVIFQIGIIDCAKRILSDRAKAFFTAAPFGKYITRFLHNHRQFIVKLRHRLGMDVRKIPATLFSETLEKIAHRLMKNGTSFIFLETPLFSRNYELDYFPLINDDLSAYNQLMRKYPSDVLLPDRLITAELWQLGTVHFNALGHRLIADQIKNLILQTTSKRVPLVGAEKKST